MASADAPHFFFASEPRKAWTSSADSQLGEATELGTLLEADGEPTLSFRPYDWGSNEEDEQGS